MFNLLGHPSTPRCVHIEISNLHADRVTDVQVLCDDTDETVVWNPPGCEVTGYDVRFWLGGQVIHLQEGVTDTWYTPPESVQNAANTQVHYW